MHVRRRRLALAVVLLVTIVTAGVVGLLGARGEDGGRSSSDARPAAVRTQRSVEARSSSQPTRAVVPANATLRSGDRGEPVRKLQRALKAVGFDPGPGGADGVFGEATRNAVVSFQTTNGLSADGVVGGETARALNAVASGREVRAGADLRRRAEVLRSR